MCPCPLIIGKDTRSHLLAIPREIRDETFAYYTDIGEDDELVIAGSEFFLYQRAINGAWFHPPTAFFPAFLRINRQVYDEGHPTIFRRNPVSIVLNEGSFLGRQDGITSRPAKSDVESTAQRPSRVSALSSLVRIPGSEKLWWA
ncbi:hypothetical protein N7G274_010343 [Stereocaulon virgatum]|uniref:Uncharacterized protein n=1 Tax=Stereocaulon virgatum TaxID=373712 RepID=A0ABR3ZVZ2_9LECA